jgi:predicted Zn-dependent peptidase
MKTLVVALLFFCSTCVLGNGVKVPPFERVQRPNGAVVLLTERHDVPLIAFTAVVRGGAVSDPAG